MAVKLPTAKILCFHQWWSVRFTPSPSTGFCLVYQQYVLLTSVYTCWWSQQYYAEIQWLIAWKSTCSQNKCQSSNKPTCMSVGRIFSRGGPRGFFLNFSSGAKSGEIWFFPLETKKTTFFAENFKIQGRQGPPLSFPTHMSTWHNTIRICFPIVIGL